MNEQKLPNATVVLVLGIVSIVCCWCYGIVGIITGSIALYLYNKDKKLYDLNPTQYSNFSQLNTGRIMAIIGIVLSIIYLFLIVFVISMFGVEALSNPDLMEQKINEMFPR